jgi:uncharacterized protein YndB with AHSA1/START domain
MTNPDVSHRFELELEVPGTPEQVWRAIATAEGITSWMLPTELDARPGGVLTFHMGPDAESSGRVRVFEPVRRFVYEEDWATLVGHAGADVSPLVTEFVVEARSGGTCVVRVVTSAFGTGADWENEFFEEMGKGWAPMLDNLRLYLTYFPDQHATSLFAAATFPATPEAVIAAVHRELAVGAVGDPVDVRGLHGRLERMIDRYHLLLRVDDPLRGFLSFFAFGAAEESAIHLVGHLFGADAPGYVEREQPAWQSWLEGVATDVTAARPA